MRKVRTMEKRTYLEDIPEERMREILNDPERKRQREEDTKKAIERQLKLRQAEQNSNPSEKKA